MVVSGVGFIMGFLLIAHFSIRNSLKSATRINNLMIQSFNPVATERSKPLELGDAGQVDL